MKIASFNINNIKRRLPNLLDWLREADPDVLCLQELKATDAEFPAPAIRKAGYEAVWRGQKSWNGVAILARSAPVLTLSELPGDPADTQSRYIEAAVNGVIIASLDAPNGNLQPGPKFAYKLAWLQRLIARTAALLASGVPVVLAGDYNVVPTSTTRNLGTRTPFYSRRAVLPTNTFSRRVGLTRSARFIRKSRCTHSGTTCGNDGSVMPDCALITFF